MKKVRIMLAGIVLVAGLGTAGAQAWVSGRVINGPVFDGGHRLLFSQHDNIYGTSRSASMGGAFASLGADLSSMSINPAGLGMYQSSDWGFTTALSFNNMNTTSPYMASGSLSAGGKRTAFGLNNIGAAYNVYNSSGALTSLTLGFSYNRAANFNSRTTVDTFGEDSSIADMFARQLNLMSGADNLNLPGDLESSAYPWENNDIFLEEWGAVLGYQTGLAGINDNGEFGYFNGALPSDSYFGSVVRGGINEYNFSIGANLTNLFYVGATVGITDIAYTEETSYEEFYPSVDAMFEHMWFDQNTNIMGSGVTAKIGVIARPTEALRIGAAFHLPTYYTIEKAYTGAMGTALGQNRYSADTGNTLRDSQRFSTAPRMLAGVSGVVANRAILALDWEVAWYDQIRVRSNNSTEVDQSKDESKNLYKPGHTFRVGFEYLLSDVVALRAGGSYMMDFLRSSEFDPGKSDNPAGRDGFSLTAGIGFTVGRNGYIDVAYVHNRTRMTDYDFYFYDDGNWVASQYDLSGGSERFRNYTPTRTRNMITLTLGNRF